MTAEERRTKILAFLKDKGTIRTSELASMLNVTSETIRKDLLCLKSRNLLKKTHGFAEMMTEFQEQPLHIRLDKNSNAKKAIAQKACEQIAGNSVIFLDAGSTLYELAKLLIHYPNITVLTNSFAAADTLSKGSNAIYFIGGEISSITQATSGIWAINDLKTMQIDIAFLGTSGFQAHNGPCTKLFADAQIKHDIINNSNKVFILADHTKFLTNSIMQYTEWTHIDMLITDCEVPKEALTEVGRKVDIIIADTISQ